MGAAYSSHSLCLSLPTDTLCLPPLTTGRSKLGSDLSLSNPTFKKHKIFQSHFTNPKKFLSHPSYRGSSAAFSLKCSKVDEIQTQQRYSTRTMLDFHSIDQELLQKMVYDGLVWSSLHGLVIGDKSVERSGKVPGVGLVHAPFALLPMSFPESHWRQACEIAPLFNELVDRVSLDGKFLQESLSRTKKVDDFTSRLLDIHSKMLQINKKEDIRLGLHRSDYMLDGKTKLLLQVELNTISSSFPGLSCLVSELHSDNGSWRAVSLVDMPFATMRNFCARNCLSYISCTCRNLLDQYGEVLGLDPCRVPKNSAVSQFAEALAKAWTEYNNSRAVIMFVVQTKERNMYDQHWLSTILRERHNVRTLRKTLAEIDKEGELLHDGTLVVGGQAVAVVYFRAGYTPTDYPSELEWRARLLMEQSSAVKCPSISYHLTGTKKIQQELAKSDVLERFIDNKEDIARLRSCFAGLWSLDDSDTVRKAIETPDVFVMKPQREGGGNNIYGDDVREALLKLQKGGTEENAAYILMQRIFPSVSPSLLIRDGICHKDHALSELGIFGAYLRNKDKVIVNEQTGYLMRTKVSSSNEGGVAAGFAVLDSLYLI